MAGNPHAHVLLFFSSLAVVHAGQPYNYSNPCENTSAALEDLPSFCNETLSVEERTQLLLNAVSDHDKLFALDDGHIDASGNNQRNSMPSADLGVY